jgi:uncharacterized membrane protein
MNKTRLLFVIAIILGVVEAMYFYPRIPDRMAVHFNAGGIADGWGPKLQFFETFGLIFSMIALLFWGLPQLLRRVPDSMMNLPNKDYWLAPERRQQTLDRIMGQLLGFGAMTLLLLDAVFYFCLRANLGDRPTLSADWMWGLLTLFITCNIIWIVSLLKSFRLPKA